MQPAGAKNWAGNLTYTAGKLHRPTSIEQVQTIVAAAEKVHVIGSRHSFNAIADSEQLVSLAELAPDVVVDPDHQSVSFATSLTYGRLAAELTKHKLALHNLPSLPHISVAGAVATATHGSGDTNANLATAVAGLELITSSGEILKFSRGDPDFTGLVVGMGATGAVVRLSLDVEPAFQVRQRVFERLLWTRYFDNFDAITSSGYSVSCFTTFGEWIDEVWVKTRMSDGSDSESIREDLFGALPATRDVHPVPGMDPINCTLQLGRPGLWSDRLPHFRMGFTPSVGEELQSEYMVARNDAPGAIQAIRGLADRIRQLLLVAEIRTVAADDLWMSPQYGRDTVAIHLTWIPNQPAVEELLVDLESELARFDARPHWGKLFAARADALASVYDRLPDFMRLVERLDPRGAFRNAWFDARIAAT